LPGSEAKGLSKQKHIIPSERYPILKSISIKYGLSLAAAVIVWTLLIVFVLRVSDPPKLQALNGLVYNVLAILFLSLGIREQRAVNGGALILGEGVVTGISIMVVYAIITTTFFTLTRGWLMGAMGGAAPEPLWQQILRGLLAPIIGGIIISTVISFILKRDPDQGS
jgi:hypothetical protein